MFLRSKTVMWLHSNITCIISLYGCSSCNLSNVSGYSLNLQKLFLLRIVYFGYQILQQKRWSECEREKGLVNNSSLARIHGYISAISVDEERNSVLADSPCTIPYNTSSLCHVLFSVRHERRTVNVPEEQHKGLCHF